MKLYDHHARAVVTVGVAQRVSSVFFKSFVLLGAVIACMYSFDIGKEMLMLAETKRVEALGMLVAAFTVVCVYSGWNEAGK
jgi:nucleoside recognition membrane protein YjiH